jgi:hypothetical protein
MRTCPGVTAGAGVAFGSGCLALETSVVFVAILRRGTIVSATIAGAAVPALRRRFQFLRRQPEERARIDEGAVLEARDHARPRVLRAGRDVDVLGFDGALQRAA